MKKIWMVTLLAAGLGMSMPMQATTLPIKVVYDGTTLHLDKAPIVRFGKVWLPARTLTEVFGYSIQYVKEEQMVYISGPHMPQRGFEVIKAGSDRDNGYCPVLINGTLYLSVRDVSENFAKEVDWKAATKTVMISSLKTVYDLAENDQETKNAFKYNAATGDFYNGKTLVAKLPFECVDIVCAQRYEMANGHVLFHVVNSYGEPHINNEMYTVYMAGGKTYIAKGFSFNTPGANFVIEEDKLMMIDQNEISTYDDVTGQVVKTHTIDSKPLKDYIATLEDADYLYDTAAKGYMAISVNDDFVLYRNYLLNTLTFVNLNTNEEVELYQAVYSADEIKEVEKALREEGDQLCFTKVVDHTLYLQNASTGKTYTYQY